MACLERAQHNVFNELLVGSSMLVECREGGRREEIHVPYTVVWR